MAKTHLNALSLRLGIPSALPPAAKISFQQPRRNGGAGHRDVSVHAPAAKWAAAAIVAPDIAHFADASDRTLPFVLDRENCYRLLVEAGVEVESPHALLGDDDEPIPRYRQESEDNKHDPYAPAFHTLPSDPANIHTFYASRSRIPGLQRSLTGQIEDGILARFRSSADCTSDDIVRLYSCSQLYASYWMNSCYAYRFSDRQAIIAIRLWLGLDPFANSSYDTCPLCSKDMTGDQWHAFSCVKLRRKAVTTRHDAMLNLLCRYARSNCCLARVEPKDESSLVPDGEIHLPSETVLIDVSGTHPNAPSHVRSAARTPGSIINTRVTTKHNKYNAYSQSLGARFVAFVLDTYGHFHKDALKLISTIDKEAYHPGLGIPAATRMGKSQFLSSASCLWQMYNANILIQWHTMIRSKLLRSQRIRGALTCLGL